MKLLKNLSGSERRFLAFILSIIVITLSGPLSLSVEAIAALSAVTGVYFGQGAWKEAKCAHSS